MNKLALCGAVAAMLLLPACHKKPPELQNTVMELPPEAPPPEAPAPIPEAPKVEKVVTPPADHGEPSAEEQMREDAEATGMTSRVTPDSASSEPASDSNSSGH